jgi:hypothetical protein
VTRCLYQATGLPAQAATDCGYLINSVPKMIKKGKTQGGKDAYKRFCIECGCQPWPGPHRYGQGSQWEKDGVPFVRCLRCKECAECPKNTKVNLCLSCYLPDIQRQRALEEQDKLWGEVNERKQRRLRRLGRRENWIDSGRPASMYSECYSNDISEQRDSIWSISGHVDGATNSAHS